MHGIVSRSGNNMNKREPGYANVDPKVKSGKSVKIDLTNTSLDMTSQIEECGKDKPLNWEKNADMTVLCFNLRTMPRPAQFIICCSGVFFFYLVYGYFQELIFRLDGFRPYGWYLTLLQFAFYALFGVIEMQLKLKEDRTRKIPLKTYTMIAFLTVATIGLSNSSLGYLNYPTQVIFKCCKLIPVLVGGILIQGKRFNAIDFLACVMMSAGLIFFTLADSKVQPDFSVYGVTLISLALCADAVIGNVQEKAMKMYGSSNSEMVLYSYSIGFVYILAGQIASGQLYPAFNFCLKHPLETYGYGIIFSLSGYFGVNFVLTLVKSYGALIAVTVTTCRKALTIVLSFIFFTKPFTEQYIWSGMIVGIAIYLNVYSKNRAVWDAKIKDWIDRLLLGHRPMVTISAVENIV